MILVCLAVLIVRDGLANWALENTPGEAWRVAPGDSRALATAADDALSRAERPEDLQRATQLARQSLARGPTQADALRDLGLSLAGRGDVAGALRTLSLAAARTPLDGPSHLWLMDHDMRSGDYASALAHADRLLRHRPNLQPILMPALLGITGRSPDAMAKRLASAPPWRQTFLIDLATQSADPALASTLLSALRGGPSPPTDEEMTAYLNRRVADRDYQLAYLDWLQALQPDALAQAAPVYDGDFKGLAGPPPFNWTLGAGVGGEAVLSTRPDGVPGSALLVRYDGYSQPQLASQLLALPPGAYWFSGWVRSSGDAANALAWTLTCAEDSGHVLAQAQTPTAPAAWRPFGARLQIPQTGCTGQWLRLTPTPAEHERDVEVWFRGLAIRPD